MNTKDLIPLGVPLGEPVERARELVQSLVEQGRNRAQLEQEIASIVANPAAFLGDRLRGPLARALYRPAFALRATLAP